MTTNDAYEAALCDSTTSAHGVDALAELEALIGTKPSETASAAMVASDAQGTAHCGECKGTYDPRDTDAVRQHAALDCKAGDDTPAERGRITGNGNYRYRAYANDDGTVSAYAYRPDGEVIASQRFTEYDERTFRAWAEAHIHADKGKPAEPVGKATSTQDIQRTADVSLTAKQSDLLDAFAWHVGKAQSERLLGKRDGGMLRGLDAVDAETIANCQVRAWQRASVSDANSWRALVKKVMKAAMTSEERTRFYRKSDTDGSIRQSVEGDAVERYRCRTGWKMETVMKYVFADDTDDVKERIRKSGKRIALAACANEDTGNTMRTSAPFRAYRKEAETMAAANPRRNRDQELCVVKKAEIGEPWRCAVNHCEATAEVAFYTPLDSVIAANGLRMRLLVTTCAYHQKEGVDAVVARITGTHNSTLEDDAQ